MPHRITWISSTADACWKAKAVSSGPVRKPDLCPNGVRHQTWQGMGGCFNELGWNALAVATALTAQLAPRSFNTFAISPEALQ